MDVDTKKILEMQVGDSRSCAYHSPNLEEMSTREGLQRLLTAVPKVIPTQALDIGTRKTNGMYLLKFINDILSLGEKAS
jgi:hypothetical protein